MNIYCVPLITNGQLMVDMYWYFGCDRWNISYCTYQLFR